MYERMEVFSYWFSFENGGIHRIVGPSQLSIHSTGIYWHSAFTERSRRQVKHVDCGWHRHLAASVAWSSIDLTSFCQTSVAFLMDFVFAKWISWVVCKSIAKVYSL